MKEVYVIKIYRKCTCGKPECKSVGVWYTWSNGSKGDITETIFEAEHYRDYESAKIMVNELVEQNSLFGLNIRLNLMFSIEKYFI